MHPVRAARAVLVFVACIGAACGPGVNEPSAGTRTSTRVAIPLPANALDAPSTPVRRLSAIDLADDAPSNGADIETVLRDAGFLGGAARSFAVPGLRVRTVLTRVLRFDSPHGARTFVAWVRSNVSSLDGDGRVEPSRELPAPALVFVHRPGGCCAKEQATATAVWARGTLVLSVQAVGAVKDSDAIRFAKELDRAVSR